jgi:hypothetical protein
MVVAISAISTNVVSSNPSQPWFTRYNNIWTSLHLLPVNRWFFSGYTFVEIALIATTIQSRPWQPLTPNFSSCYNVEYLVKKKFRNNVWIICSLQKPQLDFHKAKSYTFVRNLVAEDQYHPPSSQCIWRTSIIHLLGGWYWSSRYTDYWVDDTGPPDTLTTGWMILVLQIHWPVSSTSSQCIWRTSIIHPVLSKFTVHK